ncbi:MAG: DUF362 domain-containing protein [Candidatus Thermoplasmatota archaeon]|nr:DUF362 domain-containing protein [Candidatus Thermoplasmatota archaeon]
MTEVFFLDFRERGAEEKLFDDLEKLYNAADYNLFGNIAIKIHFGEYGNLNHINPEIAGFFSLLTKEKGLPFLTDCNTLYRGKRQNAIEHMECAIKNGFSFATTGVPVIIGDGISGRDYFEIDLGLKHFDKARIGLAYKHCDSMLALSHFKGHDSAGFGGAIKNIGMGMASRSGKQMLHAVIKPRVNEERCEADGVCEEWCPSGAITVEDVARIDLSTCIGCGECVAFCPHDAIDVEPANETELQERIAEFAYAIKKHFGEHIGFVNVVRDITPRCDCAPWAGKSAVTDIGILASKDAVSIDQCSLDLAVEEGAEFLKAGERQLEYGEEIGLGERDYRLIKL